MITENIKIENIKIENIAEVYSFEVPAEQGLTQPLLYIKHDDTELALCGCPFGNSFGVIQKGNQYFTTDLNQRKQSGLKPKLVGYYQVAPIIEEAERVRNQNPATSSELSLLVTNLIESISGLHK